MLKWSWPTSRRQICCCLEIEYRELAMSRHRCLYPRPREYLARSYPLFFGSSANCGVLLYGSWFSVTTTLNTRGLMRIGHLAIYRSGYRRCGLRCSGHRLQIFVSIHIESAGFFSQSPVSHENRKPSRLRKQQVHVAGIGTIMTLMIAVLASDTL